MRYSVRLTWRRLFGLVACSAVAGFLVAWSGLINIGASSGHWRVTSSVLHWAMQNSIRTYALFEPAPPADLEGADNIRRAAGHYETACAFCHGSPRQPEPVLPAAMTPVPPTLEGAAAKWTPRELSRIVRHGVKYTGMPAWIAPERDDEIWAMVAFLQALPEMSASEYDDLSTGDPLPGDRVLETCARCHGPDGGPSGGAFPVIGGQSELYLVAALEAYAEGSRRSGIMQFAANAVPAEEFPRLAAHYASRRGVGPRSEPDDSAGSRIAFQGLPAQDVPACESCHGHSAKRPSAYPFLAGQDAGYIATRLRLMRKAGSDRPGERVMRAIATRLPDDAIEAVADFYAKQRPTDAEQDP